MNVNGLPMLSQLEILDNHAYRNNKLLHVAMPGTITAWDHEKQSATIRLDIKDKWIDEELEVHSEEYPVIYHVPIVFQRTGEYQITMPIAEGDRVLVVFCDTDLNEWCINNNSHGSDARISPSSFLERHSLNGAVAIPGLYPTHVTAGANGPLSIPGPEGDADTILIGKRDAMPGDLPDKYADFIAMAGKVLTELSRIKDELDTFKTLYNLHTHPGVVTAVPPAGGSTLVTTSTWSGPAEPDPVGCTDVKVTTDDS